MSQVSRFKIGQIIRYAIGPTALMRITGISEKHGGNCDRYYGVQFYGDSMGAYDSDVTEATLEEIHKFETDPHIGRLRDYGHKLNPIEQKVYVITKDDLDAALNMAFGSETMIPKLVIPFKLVRERLAEVSDHSKNKDALLFTRAKKLAEYVIASEEYVLQSRANQSKEFLDELAKANKE